MYDVSLEIAFGFKIMIFLSRPFSYFTFVLQQFLYAGGYCSVYIALSVPNLYLYLFPKFVEQITSHLKSCSNFVSPETINVYAISKTHGQVSICF